MRAEEAAAAPTLPMAACTAGQAAAASAGDFPPKMKEQRRMSDRESVMGAEEALNAQSLNASFSLQARPARGFRMSGNTPIPSRMSELLSSDTEARARGGIHFLNWIPFVHTDRLENGLRVALISGALP